MSLILNIFRGITAIIAPLSAIILSYLTLTAVKQEEDNLQQGEEKCIRCGQLRSGAEGKFLYSEGNGNAHPHPAGKPSSPSETPILGSESHFVCDNCARRNIRNEIIQLILMVIPYPLYLYVIIPFIGNIGPLAGFLIETLLVVLSVAGVSSAFGLYRAAQEASTPLAEARDRVAISQRKNTLGKKFSYYTRLDGHQLKLRSH